MASKIQVAKSAIKELEGGNVEITLPDSVVTEEDVRKNFVPRADHERLTGSVEERVNTAAANAKKTARGELVKDNEFLESLTKDRADFFEKKFPKGDVDVEKVAGQVREQEVAPLQLELKATKELLGTLKGSAVSGERQRAMVAAGVDDEHLGLVDAYVGQRTQWSDEHGRVVVMGDDGKVETVLKNGTMVPKTVEERLVDMRKSGKFNFAFKDQTRSGADVTADGNVTPESRRDRISALEKEGKFAEAAGLKAQMLAGAPAAKG